MSSMSDLVQELYHCEDFSIRRVFFENSMGFELYFSKGIFVEGFLGRIFLEEFF